MDLINFYIAAKIFGWGFGAGILSTIAALFLYVWLSEKPDNRNWNNVNVRPDNDTK